jgi:ribonuclease P protein component
VIAQLTDAVCGSQRFRAEDRVRKSREYVRSRMEGRRVVSRAYALEVTPHPERSRLGLVVSRRVGGAVERNRVKRVVREWFRQYRAQLPFTADFVVVARADAAKLGTRAARAELIALLARASR